MRILITGISLSIFNIGPLVAKIGCNMMNLIVKFYMLLFNAFVNMLVLFASFAPFA